LNLEGRGGDWSLSTSLNPGIFDQDLAVSRISGTILEVINEDSKKCQKPRIDLFMQLPFTFFVQFRMTLEARETFSKNPLSFSNSLNVLSGFKLNKFDSES